MTRKPYMRYFWSVPVNGSGLVAFESESKLSDSALAIDAGVSGGDLLAFILLISFVLPFQTPFCCLRRIVEDKIRREILIVNSHKFKDSP